MSRKTEEDGGQAQAFGKLCVLLGWLVYPFTFSRWGSWRATSLSRLKRDGDAFWDHPRSVDACATFLMALTALIVLGVIALIVWRCVR